MPDATFICIDNSDPMRNGDYAPNRMIATQEAANLMVAGRLQSNPENTIGFLTLGGKSCCVMEALTSDLDRIMTSMSKVTVNGSIHFLHGLQIASLALSHRSNPRAEKRIIAFVGSPISETPKDVEKLAKKLRKDEVAVDIVSFGCEENNELLEKFVSVANKNNNSHFITVSPGSSILDVVLSSAAGQGEGAVPGRTGGQEGGNFEFGVDPNVDPELAMVLRMSLQDEMNRQQQQQPQSDAQAQPQPQESSTNQQGEQPPSNQPAETTGTRPMTEEEELEMALLLSMQEQSNAEGDSTAAAAAGSAPATTTTNNNNSQPEPTTTQNVDPEIDAALHNEDFLAQIARSAGLDPNVAKPDSSKDQDEKKDDKKDE